MPKMVHFGVFENLKLAVKQCYQIGQLVEKAKIAKLKSDILSGQKIIKNAKNGQFWRIFENLKLAAKQCYQKGQF